ncbi:MAG: tripartite tricarboxylate transporter TctB family protein [Proteobacteria bacterium]|nr:tripartite tricarboxylate transporter TctB family protein [Pseudomonadota bacterium]
MADEKKSRIEADIESLEKGIFTGEEGGDERSSPRKDLVASIVVALVGVFAMILAVQLDNPQSIYTAPGVLPFVTGASLIIMALGLFVKTTRRYGLDEMLKGDSLQTMRNYLADVESRRTLLLMLVIFLYVVLLGQIDLDWRFKTDFYTFRFSGFELVSIPFIFFILRFFWRSSMRNCLLVSAGVVIFLAVVFRDGFQILLPGAG